MIHAEFGPHISFLSPPPRKALKASIYKILYATEIYYQCFRNPLTMQLRSFVIQLLSFAIRLWFISCHHSIHYRVTSN